MPPYFPILPPFAEKEGKTDIHGERNNFLSAEARIKHTWNAFFTKRIPK
jgi:hypothetical protein